MDAGQFILYIIYLNMSVGVIWGTDITITFTKAEMAELSDSAILWAKSDQLFETNI